MRRPVPVLVPVLILVSAVFIGLLIWTYFAAKQANPQMIKVGRTPWSAAGPLAGLPEAGPGGPARTRGSALQET